MDEFRGGIFRDSVERSTSGTESRQTVTFMGDEEGGGERNEENGEPTASPRREVEPLALPLRDTVEDTRHHHGCLLHK